MYSVFEREQNIYYCLKPLWGTHVPALVFHNPWWSCPSLDTAAGQPVYEDIEQWDDIKQWNDED